MVLCQCRNITFHLPWVYRRWKEGEGQEYRSDLKLLCNDRPKMNIESEQQMQASVISWVVTVSSEWSDRKWEQMEWVSNKMPQFGMGHVLSEWGWRERNFNTAWMQVVPKTPLSRARSHNFGQLPSWLEAICWTRVWERCEAASDRSLEISNFSMPCGHALCARVVSCARAACCTRRNVTNTQDIYSLQSILYRVKSHLSL